MLIFGVIIYFFMIRPERNRQKQVAFMQNSIKKNDKIITIGGLYGIVDEIHEEENAIKIIVASGARIKIERSAVKSVLNRTIEESDDKVKEIEEVVEKK